MANIDNRELDELFEKHRRTPEGFSFVPLADACRKLGRLEEALEICTQGLLHHPNYASGHVVRAKCLYDQRNMAAATEAFERVLELDSNNLVALKFLGMIQAEGGDYSAAMSHLGRILQLDPENEEITRALRRVQEQQGGDDRHEPPAGATDETGTDDTTSGEFEGESIVLGDEPETSDELASMTLADIFASQGYADKAKRIYEELLRRQPDSAVLQDKLAALTGASVNAVEDDGPAAEPNEWTAPVVENDGPDEVTSDTEEAIPPSAAESEGEEFEDLNAKTRPASAGQPKTKTTRRTPRKSPRSVEPVTSGREIDQDDSLRHFQRWLRNMSD